MWVLHVDAVLVAATSWSFLGATVLNVLNAFGDTDVSVNTELSDLGGIGAGKVKSVFTWAASSLIKGSEGNVGRRFEDLICVTAENCYNWSWGEFSCTKSDVYSDFSGSAVAFFNFEVTWACGIKNGACTSAAWRACWRTYWRNNGANSIASLSCSFNLSKNVASFS